MRKREKAVVSKMPKQDGKGFTFEVDAASDLPLWVQLKNRIAYLIQTGFYEPGEQLPTVRALAADLSINYNTVNKTYLALKSEGYIESTRGRGAFVRGLDAEIDEEFSAEVDTIMGDCVAACRELGLTLDDVRSCMDAKVRQLKREEGLGDTEPAGGRIVAVHIGGTGKRKLA